MKINLQELIAAVKELHSDVREDDWSALNVDVEVVSKDSEDTIVIADALKLELCFTRRKEGDRRDPGYTTKETFTAEIFSPDERQPPRVTKNVVKTIQEPEQEPEIDGDV